MKAKVLKNSVKISLIMHEAQLEQCELVAEAAGSEYQMSDFQTTMTVTTNLDAFIQEWNGQ